MSLKQRLRQVTVAKIPNQSGKHRWTREEDEALFFLVKKHGKSDWFFIGQLLRQLVDDCDRDGGACRERYEFQLDPKNKVEPWSEDEAKVLLEKMETLGHKWKKIAEFIPGRSALAVKNAYYSMLRKNQRILNKEPNSRKMKGRFSWILNNPLKKELLTQLQVPTTPNRCKTPPLEKRMRLRDYTEEFEEKLVKFAQESQQAEPEDPKENINPTQKQSIIREPSVTTIRQAPAPEIEEAKTINQQPRNDPPAAAEFVSFDTTLSAMQPAAEPEFILTTTSEMPRPTAQPQFHNATLFTQARPTFSSQPANTILNSQPRPVAQPQPVNTIQNTQHRPAPVAHESMNTAPSPQIRPAAFQPVNITEHTQHRAATVAHESMNTAPSPQIRPAAFQPVNTTGHTQHIPETVAHEAVNTAPNPQIRPAAFQIPSNQANATPRTGLMQPVPVQYIPVVTDCSQRVFQCGTCGTLLKNTWQRVDPNEIAPPMPVSTVQPTPISRWPGAEEQNIQHRSEQL